MLHLAMAHLIIYGIRVELPRQSSDSLVEHRVCRLLSWHARAQIDEYDCNNTAKNIKRANMKPAQEPHIHYLSNPNPRQKNGDQQHLLPNRSTKHGLCVHGSIAERLNSCLLSMWLRKTSAMFTALCTDLAASGHKLIHTMQPMIVLSRMLNSSCSTTSGSRSCCCRKRASRRSPRVAPTRNLQLLAAVHGTDAYTGRHELRKRFGNRI